MMDTKLVLIALLAAPFSPIQGGRAADEPTLSTLEEAKELGAFRSTYKIQEAHAVVSRIPEPTLAAFHSEIRPILEENCFRCHGEKKQKGDFRIDTLDPDLTNGQDVDWWLDVVDVLSNGEMPPVPMAMEPVSISGLRRPTSDPRELDDFFQHDDTA